MLIKYDDEADALYIQFREGEHAQTREVEAGIIVDYNEEGAVIGIEILEASKRTAGEGMDELTVSHPKVVIGQ